MQSGDRRNVMNEEKTPLILENRTHQALPDDLQRMILENINKDAPSDDKPFESLKSTHEIAKITCCPLTKSCDCVEDKEDCDYTDRCPSDMNTPKCMCRWSGYGVCLCGAGLLSAALCLPLTICGLFSDGYRNIKNRHKEHKEKKEAEFFLDMKNLPMPCPPVEKEDEDSDTIGLGLEPNR